MMVSLGYRMTSHSKIDFPNIQGSAEDRLFFLHYQNLSRGSRQESTENRAFSYQKPTTKSLRKINGLDSRRNSQEMKGCTQGTGGLAGATFLVQVSDGPLLTLSANDRDRLEFWHCQYSEIRKISPALEGPAVFCDYRRDLPSESSVVVPSTTMGTTKSLKCCSVGSTNGKAQRGDEGSSPLGKLESQPVLDHGSIWHQLGALLSLAYTTQSGSWVPALSNPGRRPLPLHYLA
jgi:hypothetical protein